MHLVVYSTHHPNIPKYKCYECWYIWIEERLLSEKLDSHIVCTIVNSLFNTDGDTHGYFWHMSPNKLINGWLKPNRIFKSKDEALKSALAFIEQELQSLKNKNNEITWEINI